MAGLSEKALEFRGAGAGVVGLSADPVHVSKGLRDRLNLSFPLLSDPKRILIRKYGVLNKDQAAKPAVFLLDRKGIVRWEYIGKSPSDRPSPETLLEELAKIK